MIPLTSSTARVRPFQVLLSAEDTGLDRDSEAQAEQARSVAVERIGVPLARLPRPPLDAVDRALRLHLDL